MIKLKDELRRSALEYADWGWHVFPLQSVYSGACSCPKGSACRDKGKHPRTTHGFKDASNDPAQINAWWDQWPHANIGIATGASGIDVMDVDPRHGGVASFERLKKRFPGDWHTTQSVRSGGDGDHLYFRARPGSVVKSTAGLVIDGEKYEGIDIRAAGAYIVAPGSRHESGRRYEWLTADTVIILDTPEFLPLVEPKSSAHSGPAKPGEDIFDGRRNVTLTSLGGGWRRKGLDEPQVLALLRDTNERRCKPPLLDEEVVGINESLARYQQEPKSSHSPFMLLSAQQVMDGPVPPQLIRDVLPALSLSMLVGAPGVGKTFLVLDMALSIAMGRRWAGKEVTSCPIVYVVAEGNGAFKKRLAAWEEENGAIDPGRAFFLQMPVALSDSTQVEHLVEAISVLPVLPGLVIFDTLSRCMAGGDENSAKDASTLIANCAKLQAVASTAVLLVHHPGKSSTSPYRGSSAFEGAIETLIRVTDYGRANTVKVACEKQKDMDDFSDMLFERVVLGESCVMRACTSDIINSDELTASQRDTLSVLYFKLEGHASAKEWQLASSLAATSFNRKREELVHIGCVEKEDGKRGRWSLTPFGRSLMGEEAA